MANDDAARAFREIAILLDLRGDSPFQVRAYRRAADEIARAEDLALLAREGRLTDLSGVGRAIADKVAYFLATGAIPLLDELRREIPEGVLALSRLPGLGPAKIRALRRDLGIDSIERLEEELAAGRLAAVKGFGPKSCADLAMGIAHWKRTRSLRLHREARAEAEEIAALLVELGAARAAPAGALARWCETVAEIVLVAAAGDGPAFLGAAAARLSGAATQEDEVSLTGRGGIPVRIRVAPEETFGAVLLFETGSTAHVEALAPIAATRSLLLDRHGLHREGGLVPAASEEEAYHALGLPFIPPELREGRGEVEAAARGALPDLIAPGDLAGNVHVHTTWSDGTASIAAMAERARALGFGYLGIADHSRSAGYAGGLSAERLAAQGEEIARLNETLAPFHVFHGVESEILADGSLDYDDDLLARLDFVIASVHSRFRLGREEQTARIVRALHNRRTTVLGHPSGRLLLAREPYGFDAGAVWRAARESGTAIELNAHERRLDVDWREIGALRSLGVPLWIGSDAHAPEGLGPLDLAIHIARKGWLGKEAVWNTLAARPFAERIGAKRRVAE